MAKPPPQSPPVPLSDPALIIRQSLVRQYAQKAKAGQNLKPEEWRLLLDDRDREHTWPDRKTCAAALTKDLGFHVGLRQIYEWKRLGAPIPSRGAIYKVEVWKWLATEKRERGRPTDGTCSTNLREQKLEVEVGILSAKLSALSGAMIDADEARASAIAAADDVRTALLYDLPARACELAACKGTEDATEGIKNLILSALTNLSIAAERFIPKVAKHGHN